MLSSAIWMRLATYARHTMEPVLGRYSACHKSTYSALPDDYNCKVELALTSDKQTVVCYHPSVTIPYEHTQPVPPIDPVNYREETLDQVLKSRLEVKELKNKKGPTMEELSKMFYTTKHRWYPVGQYHTRRKNRNTPAKPDR